ncbi:MAG: NAD+ synthase [Spirochaetota bacterium]|nr:NAD+ synthase [Spirochaetota bacterium]
MKIAIAQINPIIADIEGNKQKIISFVDRAKEENVELIIFPEMAVIGYPPMDLLDNHKLIDDNLLSINEIATHSRDIAIICGYVEYSHNSPLLYNSAAFMTDGMILSSHQKTLLPTYDVFDEVRYFQQAELQRPIEFAGKRIGITICEDIWNDQDYENRAFIENRKYNSDPIQNLCNMNIDLLINISASPYISGKNTKKWEMISKIAKKYSIPIIYTNQVGGNDSLIFDGNSFVVNSNGEFIAKAERFQEDMLIVDDLNSKSALYPKEEGMEDIRRALILGIRDYVQKCGFSDVVVGLSGGIDSALTAALAVQALGAEHVIGITMPSDYSSEGSVTDSMKLAKNLGIRIEKIPISDIFSKYKEFLKDIFKSLPENVAEENIQARVRGNILMAVTNKFGSLLLTTGNKSELAMGYCTLYGDMAGGLAVISDLPKMYVYSLSEHINREKEIIPIETIRKPPSAELRENQKDEDSLPPYDLLDNILERYIEKKMSAKEIISEGFPEEIVIDVLRNVNRNEYKRLQAPPGLKVTSKAFGFGRRFPIAHKYKS